MDMSTRKGQSDMTQHVLVDMFIMGKWGVALFSGYFYGFKTDINHEMMTCRDMFDMFSSTCLSCDMGAWHFFSPIFFSSQTLTMG